MFILHFLNCFFVAVSDVSGVDFIVGVGVDGGSLQEKVSKEDEGGCGIQQTHVDAGGLGIGGKVLAIQFRLLYCVKRAPL